MPRSSECVNSLMELARELIRSRGLEIDESARLYRLIKGLGHSLAINNRKDATKKVIGICNIFLRN